MLSSASVAAIILSATALGAAIEKRAVSYSITSGTQVNIQDPAPVGVSLEFFAFPGYVQDVPSTSQCLSNLDNAQGAPTRVRIGGTTQDRATYDPSLSSAVQYTVPSAGAAPNSLTYGPSFFNLASQLSGPTTIGINRRLNNITNGIAAAQQAVSAMGNLYAFELGNEPEFYGSSSPIAQGQSWTPAADAASQTSWQKQFGAALGKTDIIQGGVFLQPPTWSIKELAPVEQSAGATSYVKSFSNHAYPQSACGGASTNLQNLMSHSKVVSFVKGFAPEQSAASSLGKPVFFAETNSATCGGGGISPTFGAGLWIVDYVMQAILGGYQRLYFHQGTIGNCQYCWWGKYSMGAPYYGAYFAATAVNGMSSIAQLDDGTSAVGVYTLSASGSVKKAVIYNSNYYTSGTRPSTSVTLTGLSGTQATVRRLTAASATSRQDQGSVPTFGGQSFTDGTCAIRGTPQTETVAISGGSATFTVKDSEAILVSF